MQVMTGYVSAVQEGRFRLTEPGGRSQLFVLDAGARVEAQDLGALADAGGMVQVRYDDIEAREAKRALALARVRSVA